MQIINTTPL